MQDMLFKIQIETSRQARLPSFPIAEYGQADVGIYIANQRLLFLPLLILRQVD